MPNTSSSGRWRSRPWWANPHEIKEQGIYAYVICNLTGRHSADRSEQERNPAVVKYIKQGAG